MEREREGRGDMQTSRDKYNLEPDPMVDRDIVRTYDHGADERMIKDPTCGNVGDADSTVAITHITKHCQESLEEGPGAPCFQDHI